ncbi:MAG: hypothetical protein IJI34_05015 [Clostridia bacterium]|nr:hypothetical protein [Clostridia bacterium]
MRAVRKDGVFGVSENRRGRRLGVPLCIAATGSKTLSDDKKNGLCISPFRKYW